MTQADAQVDLAPPATHRRMARLLSPTKDHAGHPLFKSSIVQWCVRFYTRRLTPAGRWFIWPTVIFTIYGGVSLQLQGYIVFSYIFGLWVIALLGMLLLRPRLRLTARHVDRICAGEIMPVDVEVEQLGRLGSGHAFVIPHRLPMEIDAAPEEGTPLPALRRGEKGRMRLGLVCNRRGIYTLRGHRIESDFPLGLFYAWRTFEESRQLMVYPKFRRLARLELPTGRRYHPGGVALASNLGESFEFIGNREYREGDNVRDIDWRASARLTRPIVREYREEYFLRVAVILDTHVHKGSKADVRDAFERAVSVSAAISDYMARQEYLVDLFAAGPNLYHLTAGRSLAFLDQILDILACVQESPDEPFQIIEPEIFEYLSRITTVICIFLDWTESRRAFVHRLAQQGAGVKVVVVRDSACSINPADEADVLGPVHVVAKAGFDAGIEEL